MTDKQSEAIPVEIDMECANMDKRAFIPALPLDSMVRQNYGEGVPDVVIAPSDAAALEAARITATAAALSVVRSATTSSSSLLSNESTSSLASYSPRSLDSASNPSIAPAYSYTSFTYGSSSSSISQPEDVPSAENIALGAAAADQAVEDQSLPRRVSTVSLQDTPSAESVREAQSDVSIENIE